MFFGSIITLNFLLTITIASVISKVSCTLPAGGIPLPSTFTVSVINSAGALIGSLNGYGNLSSPGPYYPFRAYSNDNGYARLSGYSLTPCFAQGLLSCAGSSANSTASFFQLHGNLAFKDSVQGDLFSVRTLADEEDGVDGFGRKWGVPVFLGPEAGEPVNLKINTAQG